MRSEEKMTNWGSRAAALSLKSGTKKRLKIRLLASLRAEYLRPKLTISSHSSRSNSHPSGVLLSGSCIQPRFSNRSLVDFRLFGSAMLNRVGADKRGQTLFVRAQDVFVMT